MRQYLTHGGARQCAAFFVLATSLAAGGCGDSTPAPDTATPADVVLRGGVVYTVNAAQPTADAVAVRDGTIVFVGDDDGAEALVGPATAIVELDGRMLLPGIVDAHVHPIWGALKELYQCNFPFSATPDDVQRAVAACVAAQPDAAWITGGQWDSAFFDRFEVESPRGWLDAVSGNSAVYLSDDSGHNGWANSKALEIAGVSAATDDPPGGKIVRDARGEPNGLFLESAQGLVRDSHSRRIPGTVAGRGRLRISTTSTPSASPPAKPAAIRGTPHCGACAAADADGSTCTSAWPRRSARRTVIATPRSTTTTSTAFAMPMRPTTSIRASSRSFSTACRHRRVRPPCWRRTLPDEAHGDDFDGGPLHVAKDLLARDLIELERRGYTVKIHTAGDRSVRDALDAIETARAANGDTGLRHELAHAGYIGDADLARFAALDVVADFSPVIWHPSPIIDAVLAAVGTERGEYYWPVRDLLASGAPVLAGFRLAVGRAGRQSLGRHRGLRHPARPARRERRRAVAGTGGHAGGRDRNLHVAWRPRLAARRSLSAASRSASRPTSSCSTATCSTYPSRTSATRGS